MRSDFEESAFSLCTCSLLLSGGGLFLTRRVTLALTQVRGCFPPCTLAACGAAKGSELPCRWPGTGLERTWEAPSSPALCRAGGVGAAASCGADTSSHRGGVGPPCGPRGPPATGPCAEGPHLLGGKAPGVCCGVGGLGRARGWPGEALLSHWPCSSPPGSEPQPEARSLEVPPGVLELGGLSRGAQGPRAQENVSERSCGHPTQLQPPKSNMSPSRHGT